MKRIISALVSFGLLIVAGQTNSSISVSQAELEALTSQEEATLVYMWKMEKYLRDIYITGTECSENPEIADLALAEQKHMDMLKELLGLFDLEVPFPNEEVGVFDQAFLDSVNIVWFGFDYVCISPDRSILANAFVHEELTIWNLLQAVDQTDKRSLLDAFAFLLAESSAHMRLLNSLTPSVFDTPLFLSQELFDEILAGTFPAGFEINAGLNDAWYEPATDGQGFFITVHPEKGTVFVGWFTFDMDFPGQDVIASLGDACQRWLTAQGPYKGNQANLVVYNSRGGLFNSVLAVPQLEPIGSITLQFENCEAGTVSYDLPSYGLMGEIPIQRVASDNIAACRTQYYLNH